MPKIKSNEPDILLLGMYGQDPGSFVNQSITSGINSVIIGFEFTPDGVQASKGSYDSVGWTFAYDYFDPGHAVSPLAKLFVSEFKAAYGEDPDFYAANYYENALDLWVLITRALKKGAKNPTGDDLNNALMADLNLPSVYGGDASTVGSFSLDPKTHSVLTRPMGVFQYKDGKVTPKAFFDIDAKNFKTA
jgi:ABC-type branched-subunit amino acid transport system substrate-binding protein